MSTSSAFVPVVVCLDVVDLPTCTFSWPPDLRRRTAPGEQRARWPAPRGATHMNTPKPVKPVKPPRGEGQWALGYREPLNANEQFKKDDDALNVRARIVDLYSK